jgi:hypothetical protein
MRWNGDWEEAPSCTEMSPFICKLEADFNPGEHDDPGEDRCDNEWFPYAGYCYYTQSGWNNFDEAEKYCKVQGSNLASIHSDEEKRFLSALDKGDQWLGLVRTPGAGFEAFTDGSPVDYTAWENGEPNNGGGGKTYRLRCPSS